MPVTAWLGYTNEGPISDDGGYMNPIDCIVPNYVEVPLSDPLFDTFRIRVTMERADGIGTNYQTVHTFPELKRIKSPNDFLEFIHSQLHLILGVLAHHLEVDEDQVWRITCLLFATGGEAVDDQWPYVRSCGMVDWIGKVPL